MAAVAFERDVFHCPVNLSHINFCINYLLLLVIL